MGAFSSPADFFLLNTDTHPSDDVAKTKITRKHLLQRTSSEDQRMWSDRASAFDKDAVQRQPQQLLKPWARTGEG
jgi:hypothetical protein